MKKMMAFVFGILCAMCLAPMAITTTQVYAESITDPLVMTLTTETVNTKTVKITVKIAKNTGINGVQLNLNSSTAFSASVTGYNLSTLEYTEPAQGYQGVSLWNTADGSNISKTGKILVLTLTLKTTASDGTYNIKFTPTACYNDGIHQDAQTKQSAIQSAKIAVENGQIAGAEAVDESTGLPTWAIVLIAVGGVAIVGGITTAIILKSKKQPKTWKQVK